MRDAYICVISFFAGLILIIWRVNDKTANDIAKRDEAVQEIVSTYLNNYHNVLT
jgi:hypothetical protein